MLSTKTIFTQRNTYRDSGRRRALLAAEAAVAVEAVVVEAVVVGEAAGAGVAEAAAGVSEAGARGCRRRGLGCRRWGGRRRRLRRLGRAVDVGSQLNRHAIPVITVPCRRDFPIHRSAPIPVAEEAARAVSPRVPYTERVNARSEASTPRPRPSRLHQITKVHLRDDSLRFGYRDEKGVHELERLRQRPPNL